MSSVISKNKNVENSRVKLRPEDRDDVITVKKDCKC